MSDNVLMQNDGIATSKFYLFWTSFATYMFLWPPIVTGRPLYFAAVVTFCFFLLLHLGFVTAPTSLTGCQPNFAQCFTISWAGTLYIHFRGLLPPPQQNFATCKIHFTSKSCVFAILAALLYGTPAAGVSQTLRHGTYEKWNYGTFANGGTYIRLGGHHVGNRPTFYTVGHKNKPTYFCL